MDIESYLGVIAPFAGNFAPRNWMTCSGQLLSIQQNQALFALLGVTYGGNGVQNFGLPNLNGRVPVGQSAQQPLGQMAGSENVTLTTLNLPTHTHGATAEATVVLQSSTTAAASEQPAADATLAQAQGASGRTGVTVQIYAPAPGSVQLPVQASLQVTLGLSGQNLPTGVVQPFLALTQCICTQGVFPSRN
ncbi:phage tail protein [Pseudomonas taiwanensis]|uniref:phage tail protein n=1 Tax=Pseudomonas taiwanensis TaxID=470150 RepID=UPI0015C17601|nr:tail fiber protein [Pseudomonas taiwanensis]NWL78817.1 phage tail protein [Pseudomonas taiwanensis]